MKAKGKRKGRDESKRGCTTVRERKKRERATREGRRRTKGETSE